MKTIPVIMLALVLCRPEILSAGETGGASAVLYNFTTTGTSKDTAYYSFIIPDALARQLKETGNIDIRRSGTELFPDIPLDDLSSESNRNMLRETSVKENAAYLITGRVTLNDVPAPAEIKPSGKTKRKRKQDTARKLQVEMTITLFIYDPVLDRSELVSTETFRADAFLQNAIDALQLETVSRLDKFQKEKEDIALKQKENEEAQAQKTHEIQPSQYLPAYYTLKYLSIGMDAGKLFFLGSWNKIYDNTEFMSPWINVSLASLVPGLGIKSSAGYFSSENKSSSNTGYKLIQCWTVSGGISYTWQPLRWCAGVFSGSTGMAFTRFDEYPPDASDMPFTRPMTREKSTDPCLDLSAAIRFSFRQVHLSIGSLYKRVFYRDKGLDAIVIYAGLALGF